MQRIFSIPLQGSNYIVLVEDWAKYVAMDCDGTVYCYERRPVAGTGGWTSAGVGGQIAFVNTLPGPYAVWGSIPDWQQRLYPVEPVPTITSLGEKA